ncbi:ATP-binding protein [Phytohabitans houttuyneae]|uniref:LuxR family transcriptional regulator n=1 Tax=Phytohabitans houttuyneae TaxID=1076126 RepID=A0A6V8K586_9ACTN|nr:LuxR family transcriptional regulator [Phytohabitans houttuyneae]GFJ77561.1 LuxR family transcriptional regulator [Phytohabitans houttuyneae]
MMIETRYGSSLIGRRRHLDRTREWITALAAGRGRAVLVEGEPGIGKSSLMRAAADDAKTAGCQLFWASCDELSQAFPLLPLLDALESAPVDRGPAEIAELLRAESVPGNGVDQVAAATERLLSLVDELCTGAPVLLVVDDLQWADAATVQTLGRLVRTVHQLPLLVAGVTRPVPIREDLKALSRSVRPADRLRLHSLSDAEVARLVQNTTGGRPGPRLLQLAGGAAGNPLYVTELVDALARGGALTMDDGLVEATGTRTPGSLSAAIADRVEFLSAPGRGLLRAAALLGVDFSVSELAMVSGQSVGELMPVLDEAILAGVLRENDFALAFRHPLIRAALYEEMPAAVRAAWHRDAARALARGGAPAERVARQLLPAFQDDGATGVADEWMVQWLVDAGQRLVARAPGAAIPLLRRAVAAIPAGVAPHDLLACRLADALYKSGDPGGGADVATGALEYVTRHDYLVDLHWTRTQCWAVEGRAEEALAALERALEAPIPATRHRLLVLKARTLCMLGRLDLAGQVAESALQKATDAGDRWTIGWALGTLIFAQAMRGESAQALPLFDRALTVAETEPGLADLRLGLQINQAAVLGNLDRQEEAIPAAVQARQMADEVGNLVRLAQAQSTLGELLFETGRWDDALAEVDLVSQIPKNPPTECLDLGIAAKIRLHRADPAAARHLAEAEEHAARLGDLVICALALARSLAREQAGAPKEALAELMDGMLDTEEMEESAGLLAEATRLAIEVGDVKTARTLVERAESMAGDSDVPHHLAVAPHCRGLLDRDPELLLAAAEHYAAAKRPLPRAQALEAAGAALAERGDLGGARAHFTSAHAIYSELGAEWDLARTQAKFRSYGIRRGPHARHRRADSGWDSLTPTEMKVAGLVAEGMSNPQIAAHLFLSRRTVQTHVSHILAKLQLHSRTEIAREASLRGAGVESVG